MSGPVVVLTPDQLRELVRDAVADVLAEHQPAEQPPALLDRAGLARALSLSIGSIDKLRRRGLPEEPLGLDSPRFDLGRVLEWLRSRGAE